MIEIGEDKSECIICGKIRTTEPDYDPIQVVLHQPYGWYSGKDEEICPEDFTTLMSLGNGGRK